MNASPSAPELATPTATRPLSMSEELLWQAERRGAGAPAFFDCPFVLPLALRLRGHLDIECLRRSLDEIVRRHDVLRSHFYERDGRLMPGTAAVTPTALPVVEPDGADGSVRLAQALTHLDADLRRPFRADEPPLFRPRLYALGADEHLLVILIHHIVFDGWSKRVLARELEALYAGFVTDATSCLDALVVRYADYVEWRDTALTDGRRRQCEAYWADQLRDVPPLTVADRAADVGSTEADEVTFVVPAAEAAGLRQMARDHTATLATALLALFAAALRQLTGCPDVVIGMPISDRRRMEFEPLIGLFINAVPLRLDLTDASRFIDVLSIVQRQMKGAVAHQDLHYAEILQAQGRHHAAPFHVLFNYIPRVPGADVRLRDLVVTELKVAAVSHSIADLTLHISDRHPELLGTIVYRRSAFTPDRIAELAACVTTLLTRAAAGAV